MLDGALPAWRLSAREREIAELISTGKSSRAIAAALSISERTVEHHVASIFNKLAISSRAELIALVLRGALDADGKHIVLELPRRTNLPVQLTSFIGRESEVARIQTMIRENRLVTIVGSGGVGKTRASLQLGANLLGDYDDGVWFVELAPLSSGDYVVAALARALNIALIGEGDPLRLLVRALQSRCALLIFDNCEHLIEPVGLAIGALLRGCPKISVLATSRQRLAIAGETIYRMPSLRVSEVKFSLTAARAATVPAIALFVARAVAADDRFALTEANAPIVAEICRRLDGIPLAIELAAARVSVLSPRELRDRLDERFRLLTGNSRDALPRHRTLRALIEWSHELLEKSERALFRRLAVFANGFTLEAASAVAGDDELDTFAVFDLVASLVDKSLVMADSNADSVRYYLLESTRVFAVEKLALAGESDALASRHLRYFRERFVELRRDYEQLRDGLEAAIATHLDDLRGALDGALLRRELSEGAELLAAIGGLWHHSWLAREGIARCRAFLPQLPRSELQLLSVVGASLTSLLTDAGQWMQAREAGVAAIAFARASENDQILARALIEYLQLLTFCCRDFPAAEHVMNEAESIQGMSLRQRLDILGCRAGLSMERGDLDSAADAFAEQRQQWRSAGFRSGEALTLLQLVHIEFRRQQYQRATDLMYEAVSLIRDRRDTSVYLHLYLVELGDVLAVSGAIESAIGPAIEAIEVFARDPAHVAIPLAIELLAYIAAAQGDLDRSARLAGYANASLSRIEFSREYESLAVYERLNTRLREHYVPGELARLTSEGASLRPEAAIALARTLGAARLPGERPRAEACQAQERIGHETVERRYRREDAGEFGSLSRPSGAPERAPAADANASATPRRSRSRS